MIGKAIAAICLLAFPVSASLWRTSHAYPHYSRYDATLYKSLDVFMTDGVCALRLLSMPTKVASRTRHYTSWRFPATPNGDSFMLRTEKSGPYRITWLAFPLWIVNFGLLTGGTLPLVWGPVRLRRRKRNGWCLHCGYNLRGNRSGRCPECGLRFRGSRPYAAVKR